MKVETLINYIVVDHEEQLRDVLVLLEPLPQTPGFDAARQVCQTLQNVNGPPTLRQVRDHHSSIVNRFDKVFIQSQYIHYICHSVFHFQKYFP